MSRAVKTLAFAAALAVLGDGAQADEHWVVNAAFADGGTLTGFFDLNGSGYVGDYALTTSANIGDGFTGWTYSPANDHVSASIDSAKTQVAFTETYATNQLILFSTQPLTTSSTTNGLTAASNECVGYPCETTPTTIRYLSGETPLSVPEPASWALMLTGLAGLGGVLRARRKVGFAA
jgi:hypothetical protein